MSRRQIEISIADQSLALCEAGSIIKIYRISTARNGAGNQNGSGKTPLGRHRIRAAIGAQQPMNAVFVGRRPTGEVYSEALARQHPQRDWILTRILWLCGCEIGYNRLGNVDSQRRYIYIHGTPDSEPMGVPLSHGCIRMRNADILELFDEVSVGTVVTIRSA
ncbi:Conserved hypothetical protein [gamma proteobacterium HdN1]|nr:Conserved hypothetical protein [gamma proteobacterium HdN1]